MMMDAWGVPSRFHRILVSLETTGGFFFVSLNGRVISPDVRRSWAGGVK